MKTNSKRLIHFATVLSFAGAGIALFTKFTGLPLRFAAVYIADRMDNNINIFPNKVWKWLWIGLGIVVTSIELSELLTSIKFWYYRQ